MKKRIAATFLVIGAVGVLSGATVIIQSAEALVGLGDGSVRLTEPKAPMAASQDGNNVYIVWWTNRSGNWEVMFRASNDGGATFGDRINLSNTPDTQSQTAEILAVGNNNVFVTWWESSPETGSSESVLRVSTDGGQTFGPVTTLGTNGTITTTTTTAGGNSTTAG